MSASEPPIDKLSVSDEPSNTGQAAENPPEKISKNALKKQQKEAEKARKAAERQAQEAAKPQAVDTARHLYGPIPTGSKDAKPLTQLKNVKVNEEVTIQARVYNARVQSAKLAFLVLRELDCTIQAVIAEGGDHAISRPMVKWCGGLNTESWIQVTGLVKEPFEPVHSTSLSNMELHVEKLYLVAATPEQLPIQVKDLKQLKPDEEATESDPAGPNVSLKTILDSKVIAMRAPAINAVYELSDEVKDIFWQYMRANGFKSFEPSYLAGAATEGGSGVFECTYFDRKAYLTQSPQFYKQMAIAGDMERVYTIGPVFRAENSNTKRHLTEFTGLDYEMRIQSHYHEVLTFGENLMLHILRTLQSRPNCIRLTNIIRDAGASEAGNFRLPTPDSPATRITFAEAKSLLKESGYDIGPDEHADIDTAQEKALGEIIGKKYDTDFFTVDQYPLSLRPFYTHPSSENPELSNSYDFFMRGQEIMSGAQRIHDYNMLVEEMRKKGVEPNDPGFKDYLDAFRYGCPPHGGGGLGLNRIVQFYLGLNNVREATMWPRDPVRLGP